MKINWKKLTTLLTRNHAKHPQADMVTKSCDIYHDISIRYHAGVEAEFNLFAEKYGRSEGYMRFLTDEALSRNLHQATKNLACPGRSLYRLDYGDITICFSFEGEHVLVRGFLWLVDAPVSISSDDAGWFFAN